MMRKLKVSALVSLDGVQREPRAWVGGYFDDAAASESLDNLNRADAMLMGRTTYEYFAPAWPGTPGPYAARLNSMPKYVFSSTLTTADWNNTTIVAADPVKSVAELKQQGDGDLVIYGFGQLAQALLEHGLVDELSFAIHPVIVGGSALTHLDLTSARRRPNGVVALNYTGRSELHQALT